MKVDCMALEVAELIVWAVEGSTNAWRYGAIALQGVGYGSDTTGIGRTVAGPFELLDDGHDGVLL